MYFRHLEWSSEYSVKTTFAKSHTPISRRLHQRPISIFAKHSCVLVSLLLFLLPQVNPILALVYIPVFCRIVCCNLRNNLDIRNVTRHFLCILFNLRLLSDTPYNLTEQDHGPPTGVQTHTRQGRSGAPPQPTSEAPFPLPVTSPLSRPDLSPGHFRT